MRKFIGVLVSAVGVFSLTKLHNLRTSTLQTLWRRNDGFRLFISDYHSDSSLEYSALQPSKQIVLNVMTSSPSSEKQQFCKDVIVLKDAYSSDNEVLRDFNSVRHIWMVNIFNFIINPWFILVALYVCYRGREMFDWFLGKLSPILNFFGAIKPSKKVKATKVDSEELIFELYECERCKLELRPAAGRARAIFSNPRFRCPRCRSTAKKFFNTEDMSDPRAVARKERIRKEEAEREAYYNQLGEDDDVDDDANESKED